MRNETEEGPEEGPKNVNLNEVKRFILSEQPRIFRFEIEWTKREGQAFQDNALLEQNIQMMGGDPIEQSNGALEQLQKLQYSYGMFGNQ